MRGGFRMAVYPAMPVSQVDVAATQAAREELHWQLRLRAYLLSMLASVSVGDDRLAIEVAVSSGNGRLG